MPARKRMGCCCTEQLGKVYHTLNDWLALGVGWAYNIQE